MPSSQIRAMASENLLGQDSFEQEKEDKVLHHLVLLKFEAAATHHSGLRSCRTRLCIESSFSSC